MTKIFLKMFTIIRTHPNKNVRKSNRKIEKEKWENLQEINIV